MRPKTLLSAIFLGGFFALCTALDASAATVRGRVSHQNGNAAVGYAVTVSSNPQRARSSPVTVGSDGMYYLFNVRPGSYYLEVWIPGHGPQVYEIKVHESYTDIPKITVP
jgi:hypothetical protein